MKKVLCLCFVTVFTGVVWAGPVDKPVEDVLDQYFVIQSSLANDSTQGVEETVHRGNSTLFDIQHQS